MSRLKPSQYVPRVDRTDKSFQFTADFLAAIFTWGGIGWVADRQLGTAPTLMIIGFVVGNMAGIYLLYLRSGDGGGTGPRDEPRPDTTDIPQSHPDTERP